MSENAQRYPTWIYHEDGSSKIVYSQEEHEAHDSREWDTCPLHLRPTPQQELDDVEQEAPETAEQEPLFQEEPSIPIKRGRGRPRKV